MKKAFKFGCFGIIALFAIVIIALIIDISNDDPKEKSKPKETVAVTAKWEEKIKEIASSDKTPPEKFDEISKYAQGYKPSKDEVKQFRDEIIKEYKDKNYLKDISNHKYMLKNLFKSQVIDKIAFSKAHKELLIKLYNIEISRSEYNQLVDAFYRPQQK
ncbi:hypothetical protein OB990_27045 [Bacillus cereus]|nr:hypothetical protein [Bacillus cereus]